ncbi:MAG TPA: tRNA guanosine(34) transglycosylase Tgt, partial [Acidimicrobiales bacterium]
MTLRIDVEATDGAARSATVATARGTFRTPCFMPVGTRGSVKALSSDDMARLGAEVVLANTYHLMLRPGAAVVEAMGGIHGFAAWDGHTLTDSGGFQVFSLNPHVDDDGVTFRSTYDGSSHRLTPEAAVEVQERLGADIQMVLDVCPPLPSAPEVVRLAVERTAAWAARARRAHRREGQALFGIVQGGVDEGLRREAAQRTVELDFAGYGIGGLSVGESRAEMLPALAAALDELPADRPRYLM